MKKFSVVFLITLLLAFTFVSCNNEPAKAAGEVETAKAKSMMTSARTLANTPPSTGGASVSIDAEIGKITYEGCTVDGKTFSGVYEMKIDGTVATVHVDLKCGDDRLRLDAKGGFENGTFSFDANATIRIDGEDYTLNAGSLIFFQITAPDPQG